MSIVDRILEQPELRDAPPVLVDVGASGGVHPKWRSITAYSICVAFDADERELTPTTDDEGAFKRLHTYNRLVAESAGEPSAFYLTASPYCSSRLPPDEANLEKYAFARLFDVVSVSELRTIDLPTVLRELGLSRVDWLKLDSQGTDLRLFRSLGDDLISKIIVAEFEPGIISAYLGEDTLSDLMADMRARSFWPSELDVKGSQRLPLQIAESRLRRWQRGLVNVALKSAPGWAEVEYFNDFSREEAFGKREFLLGCAFACVRRQYGFALELASRGHRRFGDGVFEEVGDAALRRLKLGYARLPLSAVRAAGRSLARVAERF